MKNELLIFIPTYNERDNVGPLLDRILALGLPADVLFVDDNSPDGTGLLLDELASRRATVFVRHRAGKLGIGTAHSEGIRWAYDQGYRLLLTMDSDFTHLPEYIPDFLAKSETADVVVGTRYDRREGLRGWNAYRRVQSQLGHFATGFFLGMPFDATGAFRLYRLDRVSRHFVDSVHSRGYSFFFESLYVLHMNGYRIVETSIRLGDRTAGSSKMQPKDAFHSLFHLAHTYFTTRINRERFEIAEPFQPDAAATSIVAEPGWESYWSRKDNRPALMVYDLIAAFYRKAIIRPALNRELSRSFPAGSHLLHAGCGSGQIDRDIGARIGISALDTSPAALSIYKKANRNHLRLLHGSVMQIPAAEGSFDGVYTVGLMEHFSEGEIVAALAEFRRVLRPGGRITLFWRPVWGPSVLTLKAAHFMLNRVLRRNVELHPPERTLMKSRSQVKSYLEQAGFTLRRFTVGARDLFTYVVIVADAA